MCCRTCFAIRSTKYSTAWRFVTWTGGARVRCQHAQHSAWIRSTTHLCAWLYASWAVALPTLIKVGMIMKLLLLLLLVSGVAYELGLICSDGRCSSLVSWWLVLGMLLWSVEACCALLLRSWFLDRVVTSGTALDAAVSSVLSCGSAGGLLCCFALLWCALMSSGPVIGSPDLQRCVFTLQNMMSCTAGLCCCHISTCCPLCSCTVLWGPADSLLPCWVL